MKCAYCKFAAPFIDRAAEYVIDGQAVCETHVDAPTELPFGQGLRLVQDSPERWADQ